MKTNIKKTNSFTRSLNVVVPWDSLKEEFNKEFLGEIPIDPEVGKQGDLGKPIVESNPENEISKIYFNLANKIKSVFFNN